MNKILFSIFFTFIVFKLFAQQPVVAVAPFDGISGISSTEANMINRVFTIRLGNTQKVTFVDRTIVERVIQEHHFQAGDWSNSQKTAELARALNADWIVRGEVEKFGNSILLTVQFYDIQTFRFMGGGDLRIANVDEAYDKMDPLVDKLVQIISANNIGPLIGKWKAKNKNFVLEFRSDGTFVGTDYYSKVSTSFWCTDKGKYNYYVDDGTGGISREEYRLTRGFVSGTYTFTSGTITLIYNISGSMETNILVRSQVWYNDSISTNSNYSSQNNTCSVSYNISSDRRTLRIGQHSLFIENVTNGYSPVAAIYYSEFIKE